MSTYNDFFIHKGKYRTSFSSTPEARLEGMELTLEKEVAFIQFL